MSRLKSSWMPVKTICSAIAPATATVIPLTARAGPPGSSCRRRTASCHATLPAPSRADRPARRPTAAARRRRRAARSRRPRPAARRRPAASSPAAGTSASSPSAGSSSRHQSRRRRVASARRTTPSGSATTRRSASSETSTAAAGTPTAPRRPSARLGVTSPGYTLVSQIETWSANARATRKASAPRSSPASALISASPAAIRRAIRWSAPISRSAASRRSRSSPPVRTAAPTSTATGSSSATSTITTSSARIGFRPGCGPRRAEVVEPPHAAARRSGRARPRRTPSSVGPSSPAAPIVPATRPGMRGASSRRPSGVASTSRSAGETNTSPARGARVEAGRERRRPAAAARGCRARESACRRRRRARRRAAPGADSPRRRRRRRHCAPAPRAWRPSWIAGIDAATAAPRRPARRRSR